MAADKLDELALDNCFWNAISTDRPFFDWFTGQSKFSGLSLDLDRTQKWHQLWAIPPGTTGGCETDITLFLIETRLSHRYAIHIENKPAHGKWQPNQVKNYEVRAAYRMAKWGHEGYQTALIAPQSFLDAHMDDAARFGFVVSYEQIAKFVPEFGQI